jgi:hypothetical protein
MRHGRVPVEFGDLALASARSDRRVSTRKPASLSRFTLEGVATKNPANALFTGKMTIMRQPADGHRTMRGHEKN